MALVRALKQELEETRRWPISSQHLAWVVQKLDSAIHHINRYPMDKCYEN